MMNGVSIGLLVVAALVPTLGQAQQPTPLPELSYNYAELSYDESDFDLGGADDVDGDGLTLSGSFEITEDWHAYASYTNSDLDFSIDIDTWALGAGYRYPLQDNVDIYGRVLYINSEVDGPGPFAAATTTASGCKRASACASAKCSRSRAAFSTSMSATATRRCRRAPAITSRGTSRPASA